MVIDRTTKDSVYGVIVFFAQAEDYVLRRVTVDYREEFSPDAIHVSARFAARVSVWPEHPIVMIPEPVSRFRSSLDRSRSEL